MFGDLYLTGTYDYNESPDSISFIVSVFVNSPSFFCFIFFTGKKCCDEICLYVHLTTNKTESGNVTGAKDTSRSGTEESGANDQSDQSKTNKELNKVSFVAVPS